MHVSIVKLILWTKLNFSVDILLKHNILLLCYHYIEKVKRFEKQFRLSRLIKKYIYLYMSIIINIILHFTSQPIRIFQAKKEHVHIGILLLTITVVDGQLEVVFTTELLMDGIFVCVTILLTLLY